MRRSGGRGARLRAARQGGVAHDVHRLRQQIWSCGGRDFGDDLRCAIASPEVVAPTEALIAALRAAGPAVVDRPALVRARARLRRRRLRPDRRLRPLRGDLRGSRRSRRWPGRSATPRPRPAPAVRSAESLDVVARDERELARQERGLAFIEWASSSGFLLRSVFDGNMNPTRTSVWDAPSFAEHVAPWGDFAAVSRDARRAARERARDPGAQLHRHRRALGAGAARCLPGTAGSPRRSSSQPPTSTSSHARAQARAGRLPACESRRSTTSTATTPRSRPSWPRSRPLGVDLIVIGGDVAGGPFPRQTVDAVLALGDRAVTIRGNGERELVESGCDSTRGASASTPTTSGRRARTGRRAARARSARLARGPAAAGRRPTSTASATCSSATARRAATRRS